LTRYRVTFKGDLYDITIEGESADDIVSNFVKNKQEIEAALRLQGQKPSSRRSRLPSNRIPSSIQSLTEDISVSDLSIPEPIKNAFIERRDRLTNWDTLFFLLHYRQTGLTNKQLRSLSEALGKPISFSWFDTSFHRRDDEGLVMSKRVPGKRIVAYVLTELGKKEAEKLIQTLESPA
jgi:hypothetical protein